MAARICRKAYDIEQTRKVIPLISRETSFGQNVSKLVSGVNKFDLDLWFQVDSVKQPIKSDSASSRHMSHRGTSSSDYHFDHSFVVFKDVQLRLPLRRTCVGGYVIHFIQLTSPLFSSGMLGLGFGIANFPVGLICCQFPGACMIGLICLQFPGSQCDWVEYYPCCS